MQAEFVSEDLLLLPEPVRVILFMWEFDVYNLSPNGEEHNSKLEKKMRMHVATNSATLCISLLNRTATFQRAIFFHMEIFICQLLKSCQNALKHLLFEFQEQIASAHSSSAVGSVLSLPVHHGFINLLLFFNRRIFHYCL